MSNQVINDLDSLFKDSPTELAQRTLVPSLCKLYDIGGTDGKLTVNPITFADERAMIIASEAGENAINALLARCVPEVPPEQMLEIDKIALVVKLRSISYGQEYTVTHKCPACKTDNALTYDLDKLKIKTVGEDFTIPIKVHLPDLDVEAEVVLITGADDEYTRTPILAMDNIRRFVTKIGGNDDKLFISMVLEDPRFSLKDMHTLVAAIGGSGYGIDTTASYDCNGCQKTNIVALPLDVDFFSVS